MRALLALAILVPSLATAREADWMCVQEWDCPPTHSIPKGLDKRDGQVMCTSSQTVESIAATKVNAKPKWVNMAQVAEKLDIGMYRREGNDDVLLWQRKSELNFPKPVTGCYER